MEMILATKANQKREFTRAAWDRLGKEKSGWSAMPAEAQQQNLENRKAAANKPAPAIGTPTNTAHVVGAPKVETPKTVAELRAELEEAEKREAAANPPEDKNGEQQKNGNSQVDAEGNNVSVIKAIEHMKTLSTVEELDAYIEGDVRATVIAAAAKLKT